MMTSEARRILDAGLLTADQVRVLDALTAFPQTLDQITDRAFLSSRRATERALRALVLAGMPVVTDGDGARISEDIEDMERRARALCSRAAKIFRRGRALRTTARRKRAALTPSYAVAEAPLLWGGPDVPLLWDERLGRSQGGEL